MALLHSSLADQPWQLCQNGVANGKQGDGMCIWCGVSGCTQAAQASSALPFNPAKQRMVIVVVVVVSGWVGVAVISTMRSPLEVQVRCSRLSSSQWKLLAPGSTTGADDQRKEWHATCLFSWMHYICARLDVLGGMKFHAANAALSDRSSAKNLPHGWCHPFRRKKYGVCVWFCGLCGRVLWG